MIEKWILSGWQEAPMVLLSCAATYAMILVYTRLAGLRSFSKMSAADFAMTVAVGSVFASTVASPSPALLIGLVALAALFAGQWLVAALRKEWSWFGQMVDNEPLLLMHGGTIIEENLRRANVTREDLFGKLREANALTYDEVLAVVFETTGDISVLHSADADAQLEMDFLENVIGKERIAQDHRDGRFSKSSRLSRESVAT